MFPKTDKFNPIYSRKIKFQNIPFLWLTKFVGRKTLAPHTESNYAKLSGWHYVVHNAPPLVSYRYHQGSGFCNNSKHQPQTLTLINNPSHTPSQHQPTCPMTPALVPCADGALLGQAAHSNLCWPCLPRQGDIVFRFIMEYSSLSILAPRW